MASTAIGIVAAFVRLKHTGNDTSPNENIEPFTTADEAHSVLYPLDRIKMLISAKFDELGNVPKSIDRGA